MNPDGEKPYVDIDAQPEDHGHDKPDSYINTAISTFSKPRMKTPPPEIETESESTQKVASKDVLETIAIRKGKGETKADDNVVAVTRESQLSIASNEPRMASYHEYMRLDEITRTKTDVKRKRKNKREHGDHKESNGCMQNWNECIYKKPAVCISIMAIGVSLVISVISSVIVETTIQEEMTQQKQSEIQRRQKIIEATDWADWSAWSACSVTCDVGIQSRDRKCMAYIEGYKFRCDGVPRDNRICFNSACNDSKWTTWTSWSSCSATCDVGTKSRFRRCDNTNPSLIVKQCGGNSTDIIPCFLQACPDNKWGAWSGWSVCSSNCGVGVQTRYRRCGNPNSSVIVVVCPVGAPVETKTCFLRNCQGSWSSWGRIESCGSNCVSGVKYRPCSNQYDCLEKSPLGYLSVECSRCSP